MGFTDAERAFCTLTYDQTQSVTIAQRKFSTKFKKKSPTKKTIKKWHSNFVKTGNITKPRKAPVPTVVTLATALLELLSDDSEKKYERILYQTKT